MKHTTPRFSPCALDSESNKSEAMTTRRVASQQERKAGPDSVAACVEDCASDKKSGLDRLVAAAAISRWAVYKMIRRGRVDLNHAPLFEKLSGGKVTVGRLDALNKRADRAARNASKSSSSGASPNRRQGRRAAE